MSYVLPGTRVSVISGDGKTNLGFGKYVGTVTTYAILSSDGEFLSLDNAEEKPSDEIVQAKGGELITCDDVPKIELDAGGVVYGCQVWWHEVPDQHSNSN